MSVLYVECHFFAECRNAECHYAECRYSDCPGAALKVHLHMRCGKAILPSDAISIEILPSFQIAIASDSNNM